MRLRTFLIIDTVVSICLVGFLAVSLSRRSASAPAVASTSAQVVPQDAKRQNWIIGEAKSTPGTVQVDGRAFYAFVACAQNLWDARLAARFAAMGVQIDCGTGRWPYRGGNYVPARSRP